MTKHIGKYIMMAAVMFFAACTNEMDETLTAPDAMQYVVGDYPAFGDSQTRAIGTFDAGKSEWVTGDQIMVLFDDGQSATLSYNGAEWTADKTILMKSTRLLAVAYYAPNYSISSGEIALKEGEIAGTDEYMKVDAEIDNNTKILTVDFSKVTRTYSRLRIAGEQGQNYDVTFTYFTPAGADEAVETYTAELTPDDKQNLYLYGTWNASSTVTVKDKASDAIVANYIFTDETASVNGTSYALDAIVKVDVEIDETYKSATITIPTAVSADKIAAALSEVLSQNVIYINGKPSADQQTALATALADYSGGVIFNDMTLEELIDDIKSLPNAVVVDSQDKFAKTTEESVTVSDDQTYKLTTAEQGKNYIYTGGSADDRAWASIIVESGVHHITLQDLYLNGFYSCPIDIAPDATVYLTVLGTNKLEYPNSYRAGIFVPKGATLVITKASTGELTATGSYEEAAGIGGSRKNQFNTEDISDIEGYEKYLSSGRITINGGTIIAQGGTGSAGIGSANDHDANTGGYTCGDITINGGNVTATGGIYAAGIGGANMCSGGNVTITGGTVTAKGGGIGAYGGAGIGSGDKYNELPNFTYGNIIITGGTVDATGAAGADGIGKGTSFPSDGGGTITIGAGATVTSNGQPMSPTE